MHSFHAISFRSFVETILLYPALPRYQELPQAQGFATPLPPKPAPVPFWTGALFPWQLVRRQRPHSQLQDLGVSGHHSNTPLTELSTTPVFAQELLPLSQRLDASGEGYQPQADFSSNDTYRTNINNSRPQQHCLNCRYRRRTSRILRLSPISTRITIVSLCLVPFASPLNKYHIMFPLNMNPINPP